MGKTIIVDNQAVPESQTKVTFGAINSVTPDWAKWIFRSVLIITSVVSFWIASTSLITEANKLEIVLALKALDLLAFGFSKLFGITLDESK